MPLKKCNTFEIPCKRPISLLIKPKQSISIEQRQMNVNRKPLFNKAFEATTYLPERCIDQVSLKLIQPEIAM